MPDIVEVIALSVAPPYAGMATEKPRTSLVSLRAPSSCQLAPGLNVFVSGFGLASCRSVKAMPAPLRNMVGDAV
jgi:hypothetical protein